MAIRLLSIQIAICLFWLFFLVNHVDPITLPLVAAFTLWPIVGVISQARVPAVTIIPILVLFVVGYAAWMTGWNPEGSSFAWVAGLIFLLAWNGCTQVANSAKISTLWLGLVLYSPLFIIALANYLEVTSIWPAAIGITLQLGALIYALRNEWPVSAVFNDVTVLRLNGLSMLILPVIYVADPTALDGLHGHILGIGGAVSAIVMTRQQLQFRRRLTEATIELSTYTNTDQLTGLHTWVGLVDYVKTRVDGPIRVICTDIDRFSCVNSNEGFAFGDTVLTHIGKRLPEVMPEAIHARVGGDYFVSVIPGAEVDLLAHEATIRALLHDLAPHVVITVTAGVSDLGQANDVQRLLPEADIALATRKIEKATSPAHAH